MEERITALENTELESGPEGVGGEGYAQLLALYLATGQICNAKYLWKRIPPAMRNGNEELGALWNVGQTLWVKDSRSFHTAVQAYQWTETIAPIVTEIVNNVRDGTVRLIANGYTCIKIKDAAELLGWSEGETNSHLVGTVGWRLQNGLLYPVESEQTRFPPMSAEDQVAKLTDYVSVLEN